MNVLVDTSVWSLVLRRTGDVDHPEAAELRALIADLAVRIIGPIRQEILSGIKSGAQFDQLRETLRAFPDLPLNSQDYERAAEFFNTCRRHGVQGSNTDFLICAVAEHNDLAIFTTDRDFEIFLQYLPISLYDMGA